MGLGRARLLRSRIRRASRRDCRCVLRHARRRRARRRARPRVVRLLALIFITTSIAAAASQPQAQRELAAPAPVRLMIYPASWPASRTCSDVVEWRSRLGLDQEVLGSSPRGGKGAEGASTGLDWPRAGLERRLSAATQSDAALFFWLPPGTSPLGGAERSRFAARRSLHHRGMRGQGRRHSPRRKRSFLLLSSSSSSSHARLTLA